MPSHLSVLVRQSLFGNSEMAQDRSRPIAVQSCSYHHGVASLVAQWHDLTLASCANRIATARSRIEASSSSFQCLLRPLEDGTDCLDGNRSQRPLSIHSRRAPLRKEESLACHHENFDMNELVRIAAGSIASRSSVAVRKFTRRSIQ